MKKLKAIIFLILMLTFGVAQSEDGSPSINFCYLCYNGGVLDSAQGYLAGIRAEMIILDVDWATYGGADFIRGVRAADSNCLLIRYNTSDNWDNRSSDAHEMDSMASYAGADTNRIFLTAYEQTAFDRYNTSGVDTVPGTDNNADTSLSRIYTRSFSNNANRKIVNFGDDSTVAWTIRYNLSWLDADIDGADGDYWNGIFIDNSGLGDERAGRSDSTLLGGRINELDSARCGGELGSNSAFHQKMWANYTNYFKTQHDSLSAHNKYQVCNFAECWTVYPSTSGYTFYPAMIEKDTVDFAFWELDPKMTKAGDMVAGVPDGETEITTQYDEVYRLLQRNIYCSAYGGISIWSPRRTDTKPYGLKKFFYDNMCAYYVIRNVDAYFNLHDSYNIPEIGTSADSVTWIGAYGYDITGSVADSICFADGNIPYKWLASVICGGATEDEIGKDACGQNWVIWRRDFPDSGNATQAMVIIRPRANTDLGDNMGDTTYTPSFDLGGNYRKLDVDGNLGSVITKDSLRCGEGAIYLASNSPKYLMLRK